jgi:hypothetical protein
LPACDFTFQCSLFQFKNLAASAALNTLLLEATPQSTTNMADFLPSSPLSSPPESVINVAINSPVKTKTKMSPSSPREEPAVEAAAETIEVTADQSTASPKGNVEAENPKGNGDAENSITQNPDDSAQISAQKRKASMSSKPATSKKPRRVASAAKKSAQDKKWEAPFVYTDAKSPLANADLRVRIYLCIVLFTLS